MALGTALMAALPALVAGAAGAGGSIIAANKKANADKEIATINRAAPGVDFGSQMASDMNPAPSLSMRGLGRRVRL